MDNKKRIKILELSFNIMENLLTSRKYASKEELIAFAKKALDKSVENAEMPIELKMGYAEAYRKLESLSWEEIQEIIEIISDEDED